MLHHFEEVCEGLVTPSIILPGTSVEFVEPLKLTTVLPFRIL